MTAQATVAAESIVDRVPKRLLIDGESCRGTAGSLPVEDPGTGEILREVADASVEDALGGVRASGFGREGGREGIEECLSAKYVAVGLS